MSQKGDDTLQNQINSRRDKANRVGSTGLIIITPDGREVEVLETTAPPDGAKAGILCSDERGEVTELTPDS
jgi:hypothetical protein